MIIHQMIDGQLQRLMQGASTRIVHKDDYGVMVECEGIDDRTGDPLIFRVGFSYNEIRLMTPRIRSAG